MLLPTAPVPFENPLIDFHAQQELTTTRYYYYALDPTHGIIKTTEAGVREYHAKGFAILDKYGTRRHVFYDEGRDTIRMFIKDAERFRSVLWRLNDPKWEFIDMETAMAEAADDDSIYYGKIPGLMAIWPTC